MTKFTFVLEDAEPPEKYEGARWGRQGSFYWSPSKAWVTCRVSDDDELGELDVDLDCESPPNWSHLGYEIDNLGLGELLAGYLFKGDAVEQWALEQGLCPGQLFLLEIEIGYSGSWSDYEYDYDVEVHCRVLDRETKTADEVATAWEAFIGRRSLLLPRVRFAGGL